MITFLKEHKFALFYLAYAIVLFSKLWGLVSVDQVLPSGDALAHFVTLKTLVQNLEAGSLASYSHAWFGGIPFLQFYAPLSFFLMGGLYAVLGKIFSLFLIFRFFIFFSLLAFPICFFIFLKEYLGERAAQYGVWTSFAWIFYPKLLSATGIGASGAVFYGLFSQVFAVCLLFLFLVAFRRMLFAPVFSKWHLVSGVLFGLLILSHTVTTLQAGFIVLFIAAYYSRELFASFRRFALIVLSFLWGALLSAFWFLPFISNLSYTSAEHISSTVYKNPLLLFFPFNPLAIFEGNWIHFSYGWFGISVLFFIGLAALIREREYLFPYLLGVSYFLLHTDYPLVFTRAPIHYYRFFPFVFAIFLGIAGWGAMRVFDRIRTTRAIIVAGVIFVLLFANIVASFSLGNGFARNDPRLSGFSRDIPYYWSLDEFPGTRDAQNIVHLLSPKSPLLPEPPVRVLAAFNPLFSTENLSSIHFFDAALPLASGESVLFGLYAEAAWQLPFIFPTTDSLLSDNLQWGKIRGLKFNTYFQSKEPDAMARRLSLFGVNYIITSSALTETEIGALRGVKKITSQGPFSLFHLPGARANASAPEYRPGAYLDADGSIPFRNFSLGWYSEEALLNRPVAWLKKPARDIDATDLAPFDYFIVGGGRFDQHLLSLLSDTEKPVLFLNDAKISTAPAGFGEAVSNFKPIADYYDGVLLEQPNLSALAALRAFIVKNAIKNEGMHANAEEWSDRTIRVSGNGPIILDAGYFPYWMRKDGGEVYPVTPGQMLVFADGDVPLVYRAGADMRLGRWLSAAALLFGLGGYFFLRKRKKTADL